MNTLTTVKSIPVARPSIGVEEEKAVVEVLRSGWLAQGARVGEFEKRFAEYVGAAHAVALSSCTTALHLSLVAAGVQRGDEVLCPSLSFIATANSIRYAGASPVFVDIDPATYNMDPEGIERAITPRTRAIMVVHQIGLPFHWAFAGECVGGNANDLTALLADPNVSMHECKAFACQVYAGRLGGSPLQPTVPAAPWPTRDPFPDTPAAAQPEGDFGHGK